MERKNTHANKAESYDIGRPDYPKAFYEYLYKEIGLTAHSIIADIGAGTGKVTRGFLEKGNKVFVVEPDNDMMKILKGNLKHFSNCIPFENTAECTGLPANSVDLIFCGNSYHWFDRGRVIPEFKRILKDGKNGINVAIASLGPCNIPNTVSPFKRDTCIEKIFDYTIYNEYSEFLHGSLSASNAPTPEEDNFGEYCDSLRQYFEQHSIAGKIETKFRLSCMLGNVENLIL